MIRRLSRFQTQTNAIYWEMTLFLYFFNGSPSSFYMLPQKKSIQLHVLSCMFNAKFIILKVWKFKHKKRTKSHIICGSRTRYQGDHVTFGLWGEPKIKSNTIHICIKLYSYKVFRLHVSGCTHMNQILLE